MVYLWVFTVCIVCPMIHTTMYMDLQHFIAILHDFQSLGNGIQAVFFCPYEFKFSFLIHAVALKAANFKDNKVLV